MSEMIIEFRDYNNRTRHIPASRIVDIQEHDDRASTDKRGSVRLDAVGGPAGLLVITFWDAETCKRVIRLWRDWASAQ